MLNVYVTLFTVMKCYRIEKFISKNFEKVLDTNFSKSYSVQVARQRYLNYSGVEQFGSSLGS